MTALLRTRHNPTSSVRLGSTQGFVRVSNKAGSSGSVTSYHKTADRVKASSGVLSDNVKSQSMSKTANSTTTRSKEKS